MYTKYGSWRTCPSMVSSKKDLASYIWALPFQVASFVQWGELGSSRVLALLLSSGFCLYGVLLVLHMSVWVSARSSGFFTCSKNMLVWGLASQIAPRCEWVWLPAMDWHPVQCVSLPCNKIHINHSKINAFSLFLYSLSGLSTEGIYRVSGNKAEMESIQRQFDQGEACYYSPFHMFILSQIFKRTDLKCPANIP